MAIRALDETLALLFSLAFGLLGLALCGSSLLFRLGLGCFNTCTILLCLLPFCIGLCSFCGQGSLLFLSLGSGFLFALLGISLYSSPNPQ